MAYSLYDRVNDDLGGKLPALLRRRRRSGVSFRLIAIELSNKGPDVHRQTVWLWCRNLGIE